MEDIRKKMDTSRRFASANFEVSPINKDLVGKQEVADDFLKKEASIHEILESKKSLRDKVFSSGSLFKKIKLD